MYKNTELQLSSVSKQFAIIDKIGDLAVEQLDKRQREAYQNFWFNPFHTPQEFCDFLGTEAYKLFEDHYETQVYLSRRIENYQFLGTPEEYEDPIKHEDGTVTITKKIIV